MNIVYKVLNSSWDIYLDVAAYMLFGFLIAGILYVFFKADKIRKYLGTGRIKPVILSALFGIPIPLCSCGVVPVAAGLKKQGANSGAALAFMIATPESGVDSIAVSWAILDPVMTVIRPVAGFITAIATGIIQNFFGIEDRVNAELPPAQEAIGCGCSSTDCAAAQKKNQSNQKKIVEVFKYSYGELLSDVEKPFIIGLFLSGLITSFFPHDLSVWSNNHQFASMVLMLAAGVPMYVCATSSTPIAAALILKGLNPGAALVFLLAGPATNAATIMIVKSLFNMRALVIYLSMITICSILMGFALNLVYYLSGIQASISMGRAGELIPYEGRLAAGIVLAILMGYNMIGNRFMVHSHDR